MPLHTLFIEDSETIRENLIPTLAEGASEAIEALNRYGEEWDLVIVDLLLKEGSGLSVLRAGRNRSPHQHMLVLTNYPTAEIRRR